MGKKIKFMGSSHEHTLDKGDTFGGQLGEALPQNVVFSRENHWIVDSDEVGLSDAAIDVLTSTEDFKDVTDLQKIPTNLNQQMFLGMKGSDAGATAAIKSDEEEAADIAAKLAAEQAEAEAAGEPADAGVTDDSPATTTGGSTRTRRG